MARYRQTVMVGVTLAGLQDTAVVAHRPGTDGAAVSVRVGATLLYLQDAETARGFFNAWAEAGRQARNLPMQPDSTKMLPTAGRAEPAVMMEASNSPTAWARWEPRTRSLRVTLGRVMFIVGDHEALTSTLRAFGQADRLAAKTFLPRPPESALDYASRTADRLFAAPGNDRHNQPIAKVRKRPKPVPARFVDVSRATIEGVQR